MRPPRPTPDQTIDALLAIALDAGAGVAVCVQYVRHARHADGALTLDRRARAWMLDRHHAGVRRALHVLGFAGNLPVYGVATAWAARAVTARRGARHAVPLLGAVVGAIAAHAALKHAVGRIRPEGARAVGNRKPSFPSGHTTRATAVAAAVGYALLSMPGIVLPATLLTAWWLHRRGRSSAAETLLLAPALAMTAGAACSTLLAQRNPPDVEIDTSAGTAAAALPEGASHRAVVTKPSFPSGHTTGVTAEALSIAYVLHRERLVSPRGLAALLGWPVLVGASRVYRDRHWLTDVLGGWAAGTAVAALCVWWFERRADAGRRAGHEESSAGAAEAPTAHACTARFDGLGLPAAALGAGR